MSFDLGETTAISCCRFKNIFLKVLRNTVFSKITLFQWKICHLKIVLYGLRIISKLLDKNKTIMFFIFTIPVNNTIKDWLSNFPFETNTTFTQSATRNTLSQFVQTKTFSFNSPRDITNYCGAPMLHVTIVWVDSCTKGPSDCLSFKANAKAKIELEILINHIVCSWLYRP